MSAITVDVAERMADILGRREIWLVEPADALLHLYVNTLGFEFHENEGGRVSETVCRDVPSRLTLPAYASPGPLFFLPPAGNCRRY